jgi:GT2 family glycosyltransferase/glycosyltransferase involved in cell wall biosynthesis
MPEALDTFTGFVDCATLVEQPEGGYYLYLRGWILAHQAPISSLLFSLSESSPETRAHQELRVDVAEMCPLVKHARDSGFRATIPVDIRLSLYRLTFRAILADGSEIHSALQVQPTPSPPPLSLVQTLFAQANGTKDTRFPKTREELRQFMIEAGQLRLDAFLASDAPLAFKQPKTPSLSIIIPVAGQPHLTLACLETIHAHGVPRAEIIIVNSGDDSRTYDLLSKITGVETIELFGNKNFSRACNAGATKARGAYLLFLNNDTIPLAHAIEAALQCHRKHKKCGAVGAKLLQADGLIQEAGSFILPNGGTVGRGRGSDASYPAFNRRVQVDYCSAAFLLTKRSIFTELGGFDERFDPAYYEDVDYCVRVGKAGYRVIFEPTAQVLHLERGTSERSYDVDSLISRSREIFQEIHPEYISQSQLGRSTPHSSSPHETSTKHTAKSILVIDDRLPNPQDGQGQGRSLLVLDTLLDLGLDVSWYPAHGIRSHEGDKQKQPCAVLCPHPNETEADFLRRILPLFSKVLVSRSHHMEQVQLALRAVPQIKPMPTVIYDAEAVQAKREILRFQINSKRSLTPHEVASVVCNEVVVARDADYIVASSPDEAAIFRDFGFESPSILGHGILPSPTSTAFEDRSHFLTVGPMLDSDTPNTDGVMWFMDTVIPHIVSRLKTSRVSLHVVGDCRVPSLAARDGVNLLLLGRLADLAPVYERHRVFIAPTRYSAGIPLKVVEAAAYGIPAVVTPLIAHQLGWTNDCEVLVGSDPADFAVQCARLYTDKSLWERIRANALARIQEQFSILKFKEQLASILAGESGISSAL